jgi:hypothetical protein
MFLASRGQQQYQRICGETEKLLATPVHIGVCAYVIGSITIMEYRGDEIENARFSA